MKKLVIVSVLFVLLSVVTPVYADSIDGLWTVNSTFATLSRELRDTAFCNAAY